jgi:hypothetical protein
MHKNRSNFWRPHWIFRKGEISSHYNNLRKERERHCTFYSEVSYLATSLVIFCIYLKKFNFFVAKKCVKLKDWKLWLYIDNKWVNFTIPMPDLSWKLNCNCGILGISRRFFYISYYILSLRITEMKEGIETKISWMKSRIQRKGNLDIYVTYSCLPLFYIYNYILNCFIH